MIDASQGRRNLAEHKAAKRATAVDRFKIEANAALDRLTESLEGIDELDSLFPQQRVRGPDKQARKKAAANGEEQSPEPEA
jgi:hypothetical protein